MKVLFAGPTLHGLIQASKIYGYPDVRICPPAAQGDIAMAVIDGAIAIGLIDGRYEDVAAPWHKEILWAIQSGVTVLGAASLGALRAAECAAFGMIGIGEIYEGYANGTFVDDSDVAQLHGPEEIDFVPLTEALVNVIATVNKAATAGDLDPVLANSLAVTARRTFFKNLTFDHIAASCCADAAKALATSETLYRNRVDLKRRDALELIEALSVLRDSRSPPPTTWKMATPWEWTRFLNKARRSALSARTRA